ncbi:LUD domain-containing protein [Methanobrevibacter sp.]|uniref:LUD domain-containing protein n=1 Tax=Methanobrevibacter sp. TaxID=66852 RepID=UPI0025EE5576|nr:LUD domain-containing protein [Methanobrevibacter sp.]MBQ2962184.1 lactate utilization protein [Methanobrevibacter sp.]
MKEEEIESMRHVFSGLKDRIEPLVKTPKIKALQQRVIDIRKDAIDNNEELIAIAKESLKENDIDFFYADDDEAARKILWDLIDEEIKSSNLNPNEVYIAKSKSNTLREIDASQFLEEKGMIIVETDLGDRILQLKKEDNSPVHPTGPASHLTVDDIAGIVNESMGLDLPAVPRPIMEAVRADVLGLIEKASIGISGSNSIAAEDGAILMVHNEGNISLVQNKKLHIVLAGIDKLVPLIEDSVSIAKLETAFATGKPVTSYINIVAGPSKTADIEKKLLKNMYGAERVAVILLDNGRKQAFKECLWCIGCGNCIVNCPVYNVVGNEFGYHSYLGGRGVAMSKYLKDNQGSVDSGLYMCTLCGMCTENCPVLTPTNEIIEKLRNSTQKDGLSMKQHEKIRDNIKDKGSPY